VDLAIFEQPASPAVRALAQRVSWKPLENADFPRRFEAVLTCATVSGARHEIRIDDAYGNCSRPPAAEEVLAKFRANAAMSLGSDAVPALEDALLSITHDADLARVTAALRGGRRNRGDLGHERI
jgi:hypothetical protein